MGVPEVTKVVPWPATDGQVGVEEDAGPADKNEAVASQSSRMSNHRGARPGDRRERFMKRYTT